VLSEIVTQEAKEPTMNAQTPVVLITGAVTGIGRATALAFAREGASVAVSGRRDEAGKPWQPNCAPLASAPSTCMPTCAMVEVRSLVEHVVEHFGRLDVAVNNAGTEGQLGRSPNIHNNFAATFETMSWARAEPEARDGVMLKQARVPS